MCVCMYVHIYIYMCVCMYVHIYMCVCVCMYIYAVQEIAGEAVHIFSAFN